MTGAKTNDSPALRDSRIRSRAKSRLSQSLRNRVISPASSSRFDVDPLSLALAGAASSVILVGTLLLWLLAA
ncbi:MAG TPA: hypothetical protein VHE36_14005 [Sphingomicrobium sp.]|nr:hypothetical protein [Sphingomicrobium sp.]